MDIDKSIGVAKNIGDMLYPIFQGDQKLYDYFLEMVDDGEWDEEVIYKIALIANRKKICREIKNCLKIEKRKFMRMNNIFLHKKK
ncbi:MAG: hypothetical protein IJD40_00885 [Lachnospiraceae bacterium]|nr:hypothetical protein [Lachnospiraceae bacterium]